MITEDYVSFETAKLLKEKGFDEKTKFLYEDGKTSDGKPKLIDCYISNMFLLPEYSCAPTLQVVTDWLLYEHNIHIQPEIYYCEDGMKWLCKIFKVEQYNTVLLKTCMVNDDKPQAINAAIKYTLENLI